MTARPRDQRGPFRASNFVPGDRHELSHGNAYHCAPTGGSGARGTGYGFELLDSDPAVESAGVDAGFSPAEDVLRAPDVSVGVPDQIGWIAGVPPLAVEYAGSGQDEARLQDKIADLLEAGTRWVWVVRLLGPRRVEVYQRGQEPEIKVTGDQLLAPGILQNPVRAEALWDRQAAHEGTLRNLLQRAGYESVDAVREEGRARAVLEVLAARGISVDEVARARVLACRDAATLTSWIARSVSVSSAAGLFEDG